MLAAITVESYAGSKAEERPIRFYIHDRKIEISKIIESWITPESRCFKVLAENGNIYVIEYDEKNDSWTLSTINRP